MGIRHARVAKSGGVCRLKSGGGLQWFWPFPMREIKKSCRKSKNLRLESMFFPPKNGGGQPGNCEEKRLFLSGEKLSCPNDSFFHFDFLWRCGFLVKKVFFVWRAPGKKCWKLEAKWCGCFAKTFFFLRFRKRCFWRKKWAKMMISPSISRCREEGCVFWKNAKNRYFDYRLEVWLVRKTAFVVFLFCRKFRLFWRGGSFVKLSFFDQVFLMKITYFSIKI